MKLTGDILYFIKHKILRKKIISSEEQWEINLVLDKWFHNDIKRKKIVLFGSPEHCNMGDHAISIAEMQFLRDNFGNYHIVELSSGTFNRYTEIIRNFIKRKDILIVTGGGFLGNLWIKEELWVRRLIQMFPSNKIIIFPQTVYFTNDIAGEREKQKSVEIFSNHKKLIFFLRDQKSYHLVKSEYKKLKFIGLAPDFVTYLNLSAPHYTREEILLCLRDDKERVFDIKDVLVEYLEEKNLKYKFISTIAAGDYCNICDRDIKFREITDIFKKGRLVITDRLHAMLFAAITGTPCFALDNISGKVSGVYKWIDYLPYIFFIESPDQLKKELDHYLSSNADTNFDYDNQNLQTYFQVIKKYIRRYTNPFF